MTYSHFKALCIAAALALLGSMYTACGSGDECQANSDCTGGKVCKAGTDGKKACVEETPSKCTSDSDCTDSTKPKCNTTSGECEAAPSGCTSDSDCTDSAKPKCNTTSGVCEAAPSGCTSDADCTDSAKPKCNTTSGECEAAPSGCTSDADCTDSTKPKCNTTSGECEAAPSGCTADSDCSGATPKCNPGTKQCVACIADGDCPTGQTCANNACSGGNPGDCTSDADCNNGQTCNTTTKKCEDVPGTKKAGEKCSQTEKCIAGHQCLGTDPNDQTVSFCFEVCTADADCKDAFRNKCQPANDTLNVCLRESVKDEECGFENADGKQGRCKTGENPPLYCSATSKKCAEAVVQTNEGDQCNKQGDNTEPIKICDQTKGIACDDATGTCKKAQIAKEGEECDPTGQNNAGTKILCDTGMICVGFDANREIQRCHKTCDPMGSGSECTVAGTTCEALLTGGGGLCFDVQCSSDAECAYSDYKCNDRQGGGKACFPPRPSGPVKFGGICKTPTKQFGCDATTDAGAFCLQLENASQGYCTRDCTADDTCPEWVDPNDATNKIASSCTQINTAGAKACLFNCGQPGQTCPTGLTCQQIGGGGQICLAP